MDVCCRKHSRFRLFDHADACVAIMTGACAFRVLWIFTIFQVEHTLFSLYISYPISWILTFAVHILCFVYAYRKLMKSKLDLQSAEA